MSIQTQQSTLFANVSRRVKSNLSTKATSKPPKNDKADRIPGEPTMSAPAFTREEFDDETVWTFADGRSINVPVLDQKLAIREGAMIDEDRALSLENWTHLHDRNPLPTPAQRAQGALNLERLRIQLLQSTKEEQLLFLHPNVMLGKRSNITGTLVMRNCPPDGQNVIIPPRFVSIDPSPLTDATGYPYIHGETKDYKENYTITSNYVNFGNFGTLGAVSGLLNFAQPESDPEPSAAAPIMVTSDAEAMKAIPVIVGPEEVSSGQLSEEHYCTTNPAWNPFASDFFEDDDDEILRLEQERLDKGNMVQVPEGDIDADGDIQMPDYVEPKAEVGVEYCQEPDHGVPSEQTQIDELMQSDWYQAHLRARATGSVRQYTATMPAEVGYLIRAPEGPAHELGLYRQGSEKFDPLQIYKAVGACPHTGSQIMASSEFDTLRRYSLLACSASHLRECYEIYLEGNTTWPTDRYGEPLAGYKVPWVPTSKLKELRPDAEYRLSYPQGARGRVKNEAVDKDLYRQSFKIRNFSKMRDIWTNQGDSMKEESWGKDDYSCWKSEEDRRRFPKLQFGAKSVTPLDPPESRKVTKTILPEFDKMPVREFGYSGDVTVPAKYIFGDFKVSTKGIVTLKTPITMPVHDVATDFTTTGPEISFIEDSKVENQTHPDEEAYAKLKFGGDLAFEKSIIEDSFTLDDVKWLSKAEQDAADGLAQVARENEPFQEMPDGEAQVLDALKPEAEGACCDSSEPEDKPPRETAYEPDLVLHEEALPSEVKVQVESPAVSLPEHTPAILFDYEDYLVFDNKITDTRKLFSNPQVGIEPAVDFHHSGWELNKFLEEPLYADVVKNYVHKIASLDLSAYTESTNDARSELSLPTSDDEQEKLRDDGVHQTKAKLLEKAAAVPLPAASMDEDLAEQTAPLDRDSVLPATSIEADLSQQASKPGEDAAEASKVVASKASFEPGYVAIGTAWMMADSNSLVVLAGVGLLAWAATKVWRSL